jgi:hypothetical protein
MNIELISIDSPAGQKLEARFGRDLAFQMIEYFREEGLPIDLPGNFVDGITLSGKPRLELSFLDDKGGPVADSGDAAYNHRWLLKVDDEDMLTIKSLEIPKLDYGDSNLLTVLVEFYCAGQSFPKME